MTIELCPARPCKALAFFDQHLADALQVSLCRVAATKNVGTPTPIAHPSALVQKRSSECSDGVAHWGLEPLLVSGGKLQACLTATVHRPVRLEPLPYGVIQQNTSAYSAVVQRLYYLFDVNDGERVHFVTVS